jgi:hypothetical protein
LPLALERLLARRPEDILVNPVECGETGPDLLRAASSSMRRLAVVLADGKAGKVENVWLDELHGLRISIEGHDGRWPVSTIKLAES